MSINQRSTATYKLPSAEFAKARRKVAEALVSKQEEILRKLVDFKALIDRGVITKDELKPFKNGYENGMYIESASLDKRVDELGRMLYSIYDYREAERIIECALKGQVPKKKDILTGKVTQSSFVSDELTVDFSKNMAQWHVGENNHSHDRATDSWLGKAFTKAMNEVQWGRGTGGVMYYSDEYMMDDAWSDGGNARSIRMVLGPLGKKIYEDETGMKMPESKNSNTYRYNY